jgi:hypothetical protein
VGELVADPRPPATTMVVVMGVIAVTVLVFALVVTVLPDVTGLVVVVGVGRLAHGAWHLSGW